MNNDIPVIVTGGSGLLGSSLVHQLVAAGEERVTVMDVNPNPVRLDDIADQIEYVEGDVADPELLEKTSAASSRRRSITWPHFLVIGVKTIRWKGHVSTSTVYRPCSRRPSPMVWSRCCFPAPWVPTAMI